jgi:hypothetical protein
MAPGTVLRRVEPIPSQAQLVVDDAHRAEGIAVLRTLRASGASIVLILSGRTRC